MNNDNMEIILEEIKMSTSQSSYVYKLNLTYKKKTYLYYIKIGKYDYGKYNEKTYDELINIPLNGCCIDNVKDYISDLVYESIIYKILTEIEKEDKKLKNKIITLNNNGIISGDKMYVIIDDTKIPIKIPDNLINKLNEFFNRPSYDKQKEPFYYFITNSDINYLLLDDFLKKNKLVDKNKLINFIKNICNDLEYLYSKYNFIHWDLHTRNILVNEELTKYKIFDFNTTQITYKNLSYRSCNFYNKSQVYLKLNKTIIDIELNNYIDYYSLFFQAKGIKDTLMSKCIGNDNCITLINKIDKFFSENSNKSIKTKNIFSFNNGYKQNNMYQRIIYSIMLKIYFSNNFSSFIDNYFIIEYKNKNKIIYNNYIEDKIKTKNIKNKLKKKKQIPNKNFQKCSNINNNVLRKIEIKEIKEIGYIGSEYNIPNNYCIIL